MFLTSFVAHVVLKLPTMVRGLRSRSLRAELRTSTADTRAEEPDETGLVAEKPLKASLSRRGALALVFGGSAFLGLITVGQTIGLLRPLAFLLPRGRNTAAGDGGPNDFPINKTFAVTGIDPHAVGDSWRLDLTGGPGLVRLDLSGLSAQPQHTADLPLQCVEGWASVRTWTGVRLRDLAALAGVPSPTSAVVRSVEPGGPFAQATLTAGQVLHPDSLLATAVNGAPLSLDHGFPARVIASAVPGVHNTKWVRSIEFRSA